MKQSIYIECYEGLSARMLTEALLDLMPEGKAARKLVVGLRKLSCSEAARQEMLHNMQERIHEFALPADAERLFARAYGIWLNAKATVEHVEPEELRFSKRDFDGVIAMMTTAIGMEQLQIGEVICPEYLLSFERRSFHTHPPDHYAPVSCLLGMSASQSSALMPLHSLRSVTNRPEGTFGSLRYAFGGDHPSQTTHQAVSA